MTTESVNAPITTLTPSITDAYFREEYPGNNYGTQPFIGVTGNENGYEDRSLVKFDLSSIPSGARINSAILSLYYYTDLHDSPNGRIFNAYRLTQDWDEGTVTWNERQFGVAWISPGGDYTLEDNVAGTVHTSAGEWISWTVTEIVKDWIENGQPNYGFLIRNPNAEVGGASYYSSESTESELPILEINWGPPAPEGYHPVGGYYMHINKFTITAPYLALIGLIATVSIVYVMRRLKTR
jgi:hypothetical protein